MGDNHAVTDSDTSRAARMTVRRYPTAADADRDDAAFWRQIPEDERVLQAWRLSLELSQLRGDPPHEPGLRRPVTRIQRR